MPGTRAAIVAACVLVVAVSLSAQEHGPPVAAATSKPARTGSTHENAQPGGEAPTVASGVKTTLTTAAKTAARTPHDAPARATASATTARQSTETAAAPVPHETTASATGPATTPGQSDKERTPASHQAKTRAPASARTPAKAAVPARHDTKKPALLDAKTVPAAAATPAHSIVDAETVRGYVDGSEVAPRKPEIAKRPAAKRAEHIHGDTSGKTPIAPEAEAPVTPAQAAAHASAAPAGPSSARRSARASVHGAEAGAADQPDKAPVTAITAKASAAQAAATVAAALRASTLIRRPARSADARVAPPKAAAPAPHGYPVAWPSRSIAIRWPEAPDRVQLDWADDRPPDVHLRWETPIAPRP
jgi:hypothetical protein